MRREREIWKSVLHFREEKEKWILFSQDSREFLPGFLKSFPFLQSFANHIVTAKAFEKVKVYSVRNVILTAMQCINHGNYFYMSEHPHVWRRLCTNLEMAVASQASAKQGMVNAAMVDTR